MIFNPDLWNVMSPIWIAVGLLIAGYFLIFKKPTLMQVVALLLGAGFMAIAYVSPLGYLADGYVFSAHMIQHLLMLLVVPLCLILCLPKRQVSSWFSSTPKPNLARFLVAAGWIGGVGAMWFWHVPSMCNVSTQNASWGFVRDSSFLLAGLTFWWPIFGPLQSTRLSPPSGMVYLFSACLGCTLLGIYITFTNSVICPVFASTTDSLGIMASLNAAGYTAAVDQRVGGLLMWVPPCSLYVASIIALMCRWYTVMEPQPSLTQALNTKDQEPATLV